VQLPYVEAIVQAAHAIVPLYARNENYSQHARVSIESITQVRVIGDNSTVLLAAYVLFPEQGKSA
jgi:hypothetical protein